MSIQNKISFLVQKQLPSFVRTDHPHFVEFLEAYYEWLAQDGNAEERLKTLLQNQDVDSSLDEFVEFFNKEFLNQIPRNILTDPRELSKHIKQYYRAKGTEKSYKLLFRILFNSNVDFYYPRVDILRVSDGKWQQDKTLKIQTVLNGGDPGLFESRKIIGQTSNASAVVDRIIKYNVGTFAVFELFLNRSSILGTFLPNEHIISDEVPNVVGRIYPVVTGIALTDHGVGYSVNDLISFTGSDGLNASAKVSSVSSLGEILAIKMVDNGVGYDIVPNVVFLPALTTASGIAIIGAVTNPDGYYLNEDGKVSSSKKIQDDRFYQQFSYVLFVETSIDQYRELVKQLIHPAGLRLFGGFRIVSDLDVEASVVGATGASFIHIQRESLFPNPGPLHGNTLIGSSEVWDAESTALDARVNLINTINEDSQSFPLGPYLRDFEEDKFHALPSENSTDASPMVGVNAGYWNLYGNQQLDHFADWVIQDFEFFANRSINILPEPILKSSF